MEGLPSKPPLVTISVQTLGGRQPCFSEPISRSVQKGIQGPNCSDPAKHSSADLQAVGRRLTPSSWGQLCVEGYSVHWGQFLLPSLGVFEYVPSGRCNKALFNI